MIGAFQAGAMSLGFTPADLFRGDVQGMWIDPRDLTTLFQDYAGTTPCTSDGQYVGLATDKSGKGNHIRQTTDNKRPKLKIVSGYHYILFEGAQSLLTYANVDFTASPLATVVIGIRKTSDAAAGMVAELGASTTTTAHSFSAFVGSAAPNNSRRNYGAAIHNSDSSISGGTVTPEYTSPCSHVVSWSFDVSKIIRAEAVKIRVNKTEIAAVFDTSLSANVSSAFRSDNIYVGARAGASVFLNGNIYGLIVVGGAVSANSLMLAETWMAGRLGS